MPSISDIDKRHVLIDKQEGEYTCFPDICQTSSGTLLTAYNIFDRHVATRRSLAYKTSDDQGRTWSEARMLNAGDGHCPRLKTLSGGMVMCIDDSGIYVSRDQGRSWGDFGMGGKQHAIFDRVLELDRNTFLTTGHCHRGSYIRPNLRQSPTEQMVYISQNSGRSWQPLSVLAFEKHLVLCEASMVRIGDKSILALLRENSGVFEPMYACLSPDNGKTWTSPMPTCLIGHRPCVDLTASGKLLVTYRNVGPARATSAWMGTLEDLLNGYEVHGLIQEGKNMVFTDQGMVLETTDSSDICRFALRPLTDPVLGAAELEAEVMVEHAQENGVGLHLGLWWKIFPDKVVASGTNAEPVPMEPGKIHTLRLVLDGKYCSLSIDGDEKLLVDVDTSRAGTRTILAGSSANDDQVAAKSLWKRMRLRIVEPWYSRDYSWTWHHSWGSPCKKADEKILELKNANHITGPDFGYSGWQELEPGKFVCAYHHTDQGPDTSHVQATFFSEDDF